MADAFLRRNGVRYREVSLWSNKSNVSLGRIELRLSRCSFDISEGI